MLRLINVNAYIKYFSINGIENVTKRCCFSLINGILNYKNGTSIVNDKSEKQLTFDYNRIFHKQNDQIFLATQETNSLLGLHTR